MSRKERDDMLFMGFNQDASCVSIGTTHGYRIFNCQPFGRNLFSTEGGIGMVEMLFSTSLVALVGAGGEKSAFSPCHLKLWNTKTASSICELDFTSEIQAVRMNRKRLIVLLESSLHIYDLDKMVNLQTLEVNAPASTWRNLNQFEETSGPSLHYSSLCELSPDENNSFLALPAHSVAGDVFLYDALNLVEFRWINAHKSPLTAFKFSLDGTMLATVSETGTVIRVFRVPSGEKLYSFRRGTYSATVYSLAFDEHNLKLAASSSSGTVHVFELSGEESDKRQRREGSVHGGINRDGSASVSNTSSGPSAGLGSRQGESSDTVSSRQDGRLVPGPISSQEQSVSSGFFGIAASNALSFLDRRKQLVGILPESLSDIVEPSRSFSVARLKGTKVISQCALAKGNLYVVTSEGHFYQYCIIKGECQLELEISLNVQENEDEGLRFYKYSDSD